MTRNTTPIRPVEKTDLPLLDTALRALAQDLGDPYAATLSLLEQAGFGPTPAYYALIAQDADPDQTASTSLQGAIMFSPAMSTAGGTTGTFVSDLWVAKTARGSGLGRRLLGAAATYSAKGWGAGYLKLAVYDGSVQSRRFYDRLGFIARDTETTMFLDKSGFDALKGHP